MTKRFMHLMLIPALFFLTGAFAQTNTDDQTAGIGKTYKGNIWLNIAGGLVSSSSGTEPGSVGASLNLMTQEHQLLTLRFAGNPTADGNHDVGLLYGLIAKDNNGYVSGSLGVAYTQAATCNDTSSSSSDPWDFSWDLCSDTVTSTVGLPLEVQAFLTPFANVGFGLIGFGNINSQSSFGGLMLSLQFGQLK